MKTLYDRRDRLRLELESAKARLDEVEQLIRAFSGEPKPDGGQAKERQKRGDVKGAVLSIVEESGAVGVTSAECVTLAFEKLGAKLRPNTVSSLLSRLKADDVLFFDGERYRLKQYAGPRSAA